MRVLVVDDDVILLRTVARELRGAGHEVVAFDDAVKVTPTDLANADVALLDWSPHGPAMVNACRAACVPFVVFTGTPEEVPPGIPMVTKPWDRKGLESALQVAAQRSAG